MCPCEHFDKSNVLSKISDLTARTSTLLDYWRKQFTKWGNDFRFVMYITTEIEKCSLILSIIEYFYPNIKIRERTIFLLENILSQSAIPSAVEGPSRKKINLKVNFSFSTRLVKFYKYLRLIVHCWQIGFDFQKRHCEQGCRKAKRATASTVKTADKNGSLRPWT